MATMGGRSNQTLLHQRSLSSFHHLRKKILGGKLEQTFVVGGSFLHSLQTAWGKKKIELIGFRGWIFFYRWGDEWLKRSPCCTLGGPMGFKDLYTLLLLLTTLGILNSSPEQNQKHTTRWIKSDQDGASGLMRTQPQRSAVSLLPSKRPGVARGVSVGLTRQDGRWVRAEQVNSGQPRSGLLVQMQWGLDRGE